MHCKALFFSALVLLSLGAGGAAAAITSGLTTLDFDSPTIEDFQGTIQIVSSYDFGNGMTFLNLDGNNDLINLNGTYGLGYEPQVTTGRDGAGDRYFGTGVSLNTFQFEFPAGVTQVGFFGAEASLFNSQGRNAEMDLEFYGLSNDLLGTATFSTAGTFAWDQFHGFSSDTPIGVLLFRDAGHMVLDDIYFGNAIPEPTGLALLTTAACGLLHLRRRRAV